MAYADSFTAGDVLRFNKGITVLGVEAGTYATVVGRERATNRVTVALETGEERSTMRAPCSPGVDQVAERSFAPGDRVQFTAPSRALRVANRDLGTGMRSDAARS